MFKPANRRGLVKDSILAGLSFFGIARTSLAASFNPGKTPGLKDDAIDQLSLAPGLTSQILISRGEPINSKGETFGSNCDYIAYVDHPEKKTGDDALLVINHESFHPLFAHGSLSPKKSKETVDLERKEVGLSILAIQKKAKKWQVDLNSTFNKRIDGATKIPFSGNTSIKGSNEAVGTMSNCAGGVTPWGTVLSCEENTHNYYGQLYDKSQENAKKPLSEYAWEQVYKNPPEHYGWVVEVDPKTAKAKKLINLGRFAHEGACVVKSKTGKIVVYMGDDFDGGCIYKFIGESSTSLDNGTLYVANIDMGSWIELDIKKHSALKRTFKDQVEVMVYARQAAHLVGGSKLERPEDIEIDPISGDVFIAMTNSKSRGNAYGYIKRLKESDGYDGMTFKATPYLPGGTRTGFACPDNLAFDSKGNLWFTTDISGGSLNRGPYVGFLSNGLFVIPDANSGKSSAKRVVSAPNAAELTGPYFSKDEKTLFLSVQHPGETTVDLNKPTSRWPHKGKNPLSSVIAIDLL